MGYSTSTTKTTSTTSTKSKQAVTYQYPDGEGVVLTGSAITTSTTTYIDVVTPGGTRTFSAVTGGGGGSTITSLNYLDANNLQTNASAVSTAGGNVLVNGTGFTSNTKIYIDDQLVSSSFVNTSAIIAIVPSHAVGNSLIAVFNSSNTGGALSNSYLRYSGAPSWTGSSTLSAVNGTTSNIALSATGDGPLTYSLKSGSGSLPTGISLVSSGYLSGTPTGYTTTTTITFTLIVTDPEGQAAQQDFSCTITSGDAYFELTPFLLSADTANTYITDFSTNKFRSTPVGDTRPNRLSPYWPGGWSAYFDGSDSISISSTSLGSGDFTMECWVYFNSLSNECYFFGNQLSSLQLFALSSYIKVYGDGILLTSSVTVSTRVWYHIALVRSGSTITLYINGTNRGSFVSTTNYTATTHYLGTASTQINNATYGLDGFISNARIVKGTAVYTANSTPSTTPLTAIANTSVLLLRDPMLIDSGPNYYTVTRSGDTKLSAFSPFNTSPYTLTANSYSVYFDGTGDKVAVPYSSNIDFGSGDFTIEFWMNPSAHPSQGAIWQQSTSPAVFGPIWLVFENGIMRLYATTANGSWNIASQVAISGTIPIGQWTHFVLTRSSNVWRSFVNGNLFWTITNSGSLYVLNTSAYIGLFADDSRPYTGSLSNYRVLKGTAAYTANFTPGTQALTAVANTTLLTFQNTTIQDNGNNTISLTVSGNPKVITANPFGETASSISNYSYSANSYSGSAYFDGSGDYITTTNNQIPPGTGDFTWEAWIYFPTGSSYRQVFSNRQTNGSSANEGSLAVNPSNGLTWYTSTFIVNYTTSIGVDQWVHVAVSRSGTSLKVFANGNQVGSTATNSDNLTGSVFTIGANNNGSEPFIGHISNVRVVKGTAVYTGPFVPPTAPLTAVANTSLLLLQSDISNKSTQFVDHSPNNVLFTRNGNASQGAYSPLVPTGWSGYFDGTGDYLTMANNAAFIPEGNFTLECWINRSGSAANYTIAGFSSSSSTVYSLRVNTTGTITFLWYNSAVTAHTATTSNTVSVGSWNHIATVFESASSRIKVYINGTLGANIAYSGSTRNVTTPSFGIGSWGASTTEPQMFGYISNLRVVKGTAIYTTDFTPSTVPLPVVANTSLLALRTSSWALDESPNRFTITRYGDLSIQPFSPFKPHKIIPSSDYSVYFDGTGDYLSNSTDNSAIAFGSGDFTIEFWMYSTTASTQVLYDTRINTSTNAGGFQIYRDSTTIYAYDTSGAGTSLVSSTIDLNIWTHIAVVRSGSGTGNVKLYKNGVLISSSASTNSTNYSQGYVNIGCYLLNGTPSTFFVGAISNFRLVKGTAVYTANFTPGTQALTAISNTSLLTCQNENVTDSSNNNFTITINGNAIPVPVNPFYSAETITGGLSYNPVTDGGGAYFDGSGDYLTSSIEPTMKLSGDFVIEFWLYPLDTTFRGIAQYRNGGSWASGDFQFHWDSGTVIFYTPNGSVATSTVPLKCWSHVAISRVGSTITSYLNGVRNNTWTNSTTYTGSGGLFRIGELFDGTHYIWNGYLSNFRIINGSGIYTKPFVVPRTAPLPNVANTVILSTFTNSGIIDASHNSIIETFGDATVTSNVIKYGTNSYYFDGTGDYLQVKDFSPSFVLGASDYTIEFWMYPTSLAASEILPMSADIGGYYSYAPYIHNSVMKIIYYDSTGQVTQSSGYTVYVNNWYHIAYTRSGSTARIFVNGTSQNSTTLSGALGTPLNFSIGAKADGNYAFTGYLTDVRVTKGYARYTANFTVPSTPFLNK